MGMIWTCFLIAGYVHSLVITSSAAYGRMVNEAQSTEALLSALECIPQVGEEHSAWESESIHLRRRRIAMTSALRKLSQKCIGSGACEERRIVLNDERLIRAATMCAELVPESITPKDETRQIWRSERIEALRLLTALATQPQDKKYFQKGDANNNTFLKALVLSIKSAVADNLSADSFSPPNQIFTLAWIAERLNQVRSLEIPDLRLIKANRDALGLPFQVYPNLLDNLSSVEELIPLLPLTAEKVITRKGDKVQERRHTAWLAESGIGALAYSGKLMVPQPFDSIVPIRDALSQALPDGMIARYDCALVNLYSDGGAACKYHHDPNHGLASYWDPCECVVSAGEVRRFAFRPGHDVDNLDHRYTFHVFHGDVVHMFNDCQDKYQHCVFKTENIETNAAPRLSFVFKRALLRPNGKKVMVYRCSMILHPSLLV